MNNEQLENDLDILVDYLVYRGYELDDIFDTLDYMAKTYFNHQRHLDL